MKRAKVRQRSAWVAIAMAAALPAALWAQSTEWSTATSGDWFDPARWTNGVPASEGAALFSATGSPFSVTVSGATVGSITVDSADATLVQLGDLHLGSNGTALHVSAGTYNWNNGNLLGAGTASFHGTLNIAGPFATLGGSMTAINHGQANLTGNLLLLGATSDAAFPRFINAQGASLNISGGGSGREIRGEVGRSHFENAGTLAVTGATNVTLSAPSVNTGTYRVSQGSQLTISNSLDASFTSLMGGGTYHANMGRIFLQVPQEGAPGLVTLGANLVFENGGGISLGPFFENYPIQSRLATITPTGSVTFLNDTAPLRSSSLGLGRMEGTITVGPATSVVARAIGGAPGSWQNLGTVVADGGTFSTGTLANASITALTGGTWIAKNGGKIQFNVTGGSFTTLAADVTQDGVGSTMELVASPTPVPAFANLHVITDAGRLALANGHSITYGRPLEVNGAITLTSGSSLTVSDITGTPIVDIDGATLTGTSPAQTGSTLTGLQAGQWRVANGGSLRGTGQLVSLPSELRIIGATSRVWANPTGTGDALRTLSSITPTGTLLLGEGYTLIRTTLANAGTLVLESNASLTVGGASGSGERLSGLGVFIVDSAQLSAAGETTLIDPRSMREATWIVRNGGTVRGAGAISEIAGDFTLSGATSRVWKNVAGTEPALATLQTVAASGSFTLAEGASLTQAAPIFVQGRLAVSSGAVLTLPNLGMGGTGHFEVDGGTITTPLLSGANVPFINVGTWDISNGGTVLGIGPVGTLSNTVTVSGSNTKVLLKSATTGIPTDTLATVSAIAPTGRLTIRDGYSFTRAGGLKVDGALTIGQGSTLTVTNGAASISGSVHVAGTLEAAGSLAAGVIGGGTLEVEPGGLVRAGRLNLTGTAVVAGRLELPLANSTPQVVGTLLIPGDGSVNIGVNDLIVRSDAGSHTAELADITALVLRGRVAGGQPDGLSGAPAPLTTLTVFNNLATDGTALLSSFDGTVVSPHDILVKYTYLGDLNLDGLVSPADFAQFDPSGSGWRAGDINYDGVVNGFDFITMLEAYRNQGAPLGDSRPGGALSVPEAGVLPLALPALLALRRKRR